MKNHWSPTITGEQTITLTFLVSYEAAGNCYSDPGKISGPPEDCYPPEGEAEITDMTYEISDEDGNTVSADSELGKCIMKAFDDEVVLEQLMETEWRDWK